MVAMQTKEEHQPTMSNGEKEIAPREAEVPFVNDSDPAQQMMPPPEVMNGANSLPPQQVYVNTPSEAGLPNGMTGLESQFMGLRMDADGEPNENGEGADENNDEEEEELEVEPVKLFVGQVRNSSA
jgi:hypothetical protein